MLLWSYSGVVIPEYYVSIMFRMISVPGSTVSDFEGEESTILKISEIIYKTPRCNVGKDWVSNSDPNNMWNCAY
jgi:hypothetical protein